MLRGMKSIKEEILAIYDDVETEVEVAMTPNRSKVLLKALAFVVTVVHFTICRFQDGIFFSGIVYAGHGWCGWVCLLLSCAWTAIILSAFTLWRLGLTPFKRPRWELLIPGAAFLLLFVSGLSRHAPDPMLSETLVGFGAALLLYLSLFVEHS